MTLEEIGLDLRHVERYTGESICGEEAVILYSTAFEIQPKVIVEIGAWWGTSSIILAHVAKRCCGKLYSVECDPKEEWNRNLEAYGVRDSAEMIHARSPLLKVEDLPFSSIDYLLIDGDHSFSGVMEDFRFWSKLVRKGGRVAFHDYFSQSGVREAARVLRQLFELKMIDCGSGTNSGGLELGIVVFEL